jgi:uncharacterized membrane protein YvbJ
VLVKTCIAIFFIYPKNSFFFCEHLPQEFNRKTKPENVLTHFVVQKRVAMVMKKAGIKGQIMLIAFLVVLVIILFVLVFLT